VTDLLILPLLLGTALSTACTSAPRVVRGGSPPATAADGYRHEHRGMTLTYDAELGVYRVESLENHFFHRERFYRLFQGSWFAAPHVIGPWEPVQAFSVPDGLRPYGPQRDGLRPYGPQRDGPRPHGPQRDGLRRSIC